MSSSAPLLLLVPPEIRLHIYSYLLNNGNKKWLQIRNKPPFHEKRHPSSFFFSSATSPLPNLKAKEDAHTAERQQQQPPTPVSPRRTSTSYHVMERTSMFHRRYHKTTYHLSDPDLAGAEMHVAILAVCRMTYHEASEVLYGRHGFDFGCHIEAVVPFFQDRTPYTASLLQTISVYKRGPMPCLGSASEKHEWSYMCRFLASNLGSHHHNRDDEDNNNNNNGGGGSSSSSNGPKNVPSSPVCVRKLRLVVESGRPSQRWAGVQNLTESDIRLLSLVGGHEVLEWVAELAQIKGLEELDIVPSEKFLHAASCNKTPAMALYAALSASIEEGLAPFLRSEMNIPG